MLKRENGILRLRLASRFQRASGRFSQLFIPVRRILPVLLVLFGSASLPYSDYAMPAQARNKKDSATVEPTELHFKEGMKKYKLKDYEGASDEFLQSCYFARNKYNPQSWYYLGLCYKQVKNWSKAIDALSNHLQQTTEKAPDANCDIAECYIEIGDYDKADRHITQARIESNFDNPRPYYSMGMLYERMKRYGDAVGSYSTALGEAPWKYTAAWMGKARCQMKLNPPRYNESLQDYKGIIEAALKDVNWPELYYNMAECLYRRGDHQGAIDHLLSAIKEDPDHFDSHLALAHIFDEEKHISSAVNRYEHALRTAPKGYNTENINKRIVELQGKLRANEKENVVKPSPYMRQQHEQAEQGKPVLHTGPDSGF